MNMKAEVIGLSGRAWRSMRLLVSVVVLLALALATFAPARPAAANAAPVCSEHTLSVTLSEGAADTYQVVGTLCSEGPAEGKTVQLLLHGMTYARYYWDFPYEPVHYSYVLAATKRGYVTFNLDRIGNGASDHPANSFLVDLYSNAYVVHQVVEALRAGQVGATAFEKVIVAGHSMGSMIAASYASSYPGEVDGMILTGWLHSINWDFVNASMIPNLYPANYDPKFEGQFPGDDLYLTTVPGSRGSGFYYMPNADPQVVALDESLKQVVTYGEFSTGPAVVYDQSTLQITVPVQMIVGRHDNIFCGPEVDCSDSAAVQAYEETRFSAAACVETEVIDDAGHDLGLHTNAHATYSRMLSWADRRVGSTAGPAPEPCLP